jgi:hypothetical protein
MLWGKGLPTSLAWTAETIFTDQKNIRFRREIGGRRKP